MFGQWKASFIQRSRALARDNRGSMVIYFALSLPVFVGIAGLAIDVSGWQADKRNLQTIADSAALAGALERMRLDTSGIIPAATIDATANGYDAGTDRLDVYYPPNNGIRAGFTDSVEVIVRRPTPTLFSSLVMPNTAFASARAVAKADVNDTCMWSLNKTEAAAFLVSGAAVVELTCGVFSNSSHPQGLDQQGSGCLTTTTIRTVGASDPDSAPCIIYDSVTTGLNHVDDPLASLPVPEPWPVCTNSSNISVSGAQVMTLDPCVYTGAINVTGGTLHFNPGLYVMDGAGINLGGGVVDGVGLHFYLTANNNSPSQTFSVGAGSNVSLEAGTTDEWGMAGILVYHDRDAANWLSHSLVGGGFMNLDGIFYAPAANVKYSGGTAFDVGQTIIISDKLDITGNTFLGDIEGSAAGSSMLLVDIKLVE